MITPIVKETKIVFGPCRLSYTHVFSKFAPDGDPSGGKFMTNVLVPKEEKETINAIRQAIEAAKKAGIVSKWGGKEPKKLDMPLRDGDTDKDDDDVYAGILEVAGMSVPKTTDITKDRSRMDNQAGKIITSLKTVLSDNSIPEQAKKIFVLQWFDIYRGKENELVSVLLSEKLSDTVFDLLDRTALRNLIMRLAGQVYSPEAGTDAIRFIGWLVQHIETVAVLVSRPVKDVWHSLFLSLASWDARTVSVSVNDAVVRLLSAVTGNDSNNIKTVLESLISRLLRIPDTAVADNERTYSAPQSSHSGAGAAPFYPNVPYSSPAHRSASDHDIPRQLQAY